MSPAARRTPRPTDPASPDVAGPASGPPAASIPAPADPIAFQVLNEIGIIDQLAQNRAARALGPALNLSQFVVLNHFTRLGGPRSLVQLAGAMQVTKGAMTNTVTRLAAKGLVRVEPDPADGRGKLVSLTEAGAAARGQALADLSVGLADLMRDIAQDDLDAALPFLRRLRIWFDTHR